MNSQLTPNNKRIPLLRRSSRSTIFRWVCLKQYWFFMIQIVQELISQAENIVRALERGQLRQRGGMRTKAWNGVEVVDTTKDDIQKFRALVADLEDAKATLLTHGHGMAAGAA